MASNDKLREALENARRVIHELCLERGSTDGYRAEFAAISDALNEDGPSAPGDVGEAGDFGPHDWRDMEDAGNSHSHWVCVNCGASKVTQRSTFDPGGNCHQRPAPAVDGSGLAELRAELQQLSDDATEACRVAFDDDHDSWRERGETIDEVIAIVDRMASSGVREGGQLPPSFHQIPGLKGKTIHGLSVGTKSMRSVHELSLLFTDGTHLAVDVRDGSLWPEISQRQALNLDGSPLAPAPSGVPGGDAPCGQESPERSCRCRLPLGHDGAHEGVRGPSALASWAGGVPEAAEGGGAALREFVAALGAWMEGITNGEEPDESDPLCTVVNVGGAIEEGRIDGVADALGWDGDPDEFPDDFPAEKRLAVAALALAATPVSESRTEGGERGEFDPDDPAVSTLTDEHGTVSVRLVDGAGNPVPVQIGREVADGSLRVLPASTPDAEGGEAAAMIASLPVEVCGESCRCASPCAEAIDRDAPAPESRAERQEAGGVQATKTQATPVGGGLYVSPLGMAPERPPVSSLDAGDGEAAALEEDPEWFSSPKDAATPPAGDGGEPEERGSDAR